MLSLFDLFRILVRNHISAITPHHPAFIRSPRHQADPRPPFLTATGISTSCNRFSVLPALAPDDADRNDEQKLKYRGYWVLGVGQPLSAGSDAGLSLT